MSKSKDSIKKIHEKPVFVGFDDDVKKLKGRLVITSFIAIFAALSGVGIDPESRFLGIKFSGLDDQLIYIGLILVTSYLTINFLWCSYDTLQEWEIRVTGTKGAFRPSDKSNLDEIILPKVPEDPRNSTMYYWWTTQAQYIGNVTPIIDEAKSNIDKMEGLVGEMRKTSDIPGDWANIGVAVDPIKISWLKIESSIKAIESSVKDEQFHDSLKRFDRRYKYFMYSQNIRWLLIDYLFPIGMGATALYLLFDLVI